MRPWSEVWLDDLAGAPDRPPPGSPAAAEADELVGTALALLPLAVDALACDMALRFDDVLTGWTLQRADVADGIAAGGHVPGWSTVRVDRRPAYAFMTGALAARTGEPLTSPAVWAYTTPYRVSAPAYLDTLLCDSSCGRGLPRCERIHVPPGHVALAICVPRDRALVTTFSRWDDALEGDYLPADPLDSHRFGAVLRAHGLLATPPRQWPWVRRVEARTSMVRTLSLAPSVPTDGRVPHVGGGLLQITTDHLAPEHVVARLDGPAVDPERWWDTHLRVHPVIGRQWATAPVDRLADPPR